MDDATQKAIEDEDMDAAVNEVLPDLLARFHASSPGVQAKLVTHLYECRIRGEFEARAREAERTTPVSPEWMDGAEGRRLQVQRVSAKSLTWFVVRDEPGSTRIGYMVRIELYPGEENMLLQDTVGNRVKLPGIPTIGQVRDAVRLFTGRE